MQLFYTLSGDAAIGGSMLQPQQSHFDEKNKPDEQPDVKQIVLSPTIRYAGCQAYAPRHE